MRRSRKSVPSSSPIYWKWENRLEAWSDLKFWEHVWPKIDKYLDTHTNYVPHRSQWFRALETTPPDKVKVVLLGPGPHPNKEYAHGFSFSCPSSVEPLPPHLRRLFDELEDNLGVRPRNGNLQTWAERGVLLLNAYITTVPGVSSAHSSIGWDNLAYEVIRKLSLEREGVVFILLGSKAQEFQAAVDDTKHCVICAPHPSPTAAASRDEFSGSRIFLRAYEYNNELGAEFWKT